MGAFTNTTTERTPLLADTSTSEPRTAEPSLSIHHLANSLAALRAGALPSTSQLATLLRALLHSPLLEIEGTIFSPEYGTGRLGTGKLTREGEHVRQGVRDVVESLLRLVMEKNGEDQWQELIVACRVAEVDLKLPSPKVPSPSDDAVKTAKQSLSRVLAVFLSSRELRNLVVEAVVLLRDAFDDAAKDAGDAGAIATVLVHEAADKIIGDEKGKGVETDEKVQGDPEVPPLEEHKTPDEFRDEFIDRLKKIVLIVQADPSYQSAMHTVLVLFRSYLQSIVDASAGHADINTPRAIASPLALLIPVLEPFTGGPGSLDRLSATFQRLVEYPREENRLIALVRTLDGYLEHALLDVGYINSAAAHRHASEIHDQIKKLARDNPELRRDIGVFFREVKTVLVDIARDKPLGNFVIALETLAAAVAGWTAVAAKVAVGKTGVWGDVIEWVVPRVGGFLRQVPLPRIEFSSDMIEVAIDAPPFLTTSFIPDSIRFDNTSAFVLTPATATEPTSQTWTANSRLSIVGLRMEVHDVGYWVRHRGTCLSLVESGLLDLCFGTKKDGGVSCAIDFSTLENDEENDRKRLFEVAASSFHVTSFDVDPHASSHPILMWFLRPILRRVVRAAVEKALQEQVTAGLQTLSRIAWAVKDHAQSGVLGWTGAVWQVLVVEGWETEEEKQAREEEERKAKEEEEPVEIHVSGKGVTLDLEAGIVGIGGEGVVLPEGEAETPRHRPTVVQIVKEDVKEAVREGQHAAVALVEGLQEAGDEVEHFDETVRHEAAEIVKGWRSEAFDWWAEQQ